MRERVWTNLGNSVFYTEFLGFYIKALNKRNQRIEIILISSAILSVVGWYNLPNQSVVWSLILLAIQVIRIIKPKFIFPSSEINTLQSVRKFYVRHYRELEDLWFKINDYEITEQSAKKKIKELRDKECVMLEIEKHNKIEPIEPHFTKAKDEMMKYLNQIKSHGKTEQS